MLELLADGEFRTALKLCGNVFEQAIEVPGRVDIKDIMNKNGALASCMTGSGSAVYGIFEEKSDAENSAEKLREMFNDVYICTPEPNGVEIISEN